MLTILVTFGMLFAEGPGEGKFFNHTSEPLTCYNSGAGCIKTDQVQPGRFCYADAIGNEASVFKIPNYSTYECDEESCKAANMQSRVLMRYGVRIKGRDHYGAMSMGTFRKIMGNKPLCIDEYRVPASYDSVNDFDELSENQSFDQSNI